MSAYYMRKSTYQKDYDPRQFPHNGMEAKTKFFPYPGRDRPRHPEFSQPYYNSLERFDEKTLHRGRNETSLQYEDRLKHLRLSDDLTNTRRADHHDDHDRRRYFDDTNDRHFNLNRGGSFSDRGPRPQHNPRGREHHHGEYDRYHSQQERNERYHEGPLTDREQKDIYYNRGNLTYRRQPEEHDREMHRHEHNSPRMQHQEHNSPRMHHEEHNSPRMHLNEHYSPTVHQDFNKHELMYRLEHNRNQMREQEESMQMTRPFHRMEIRTGSKNGVFVLSRIPKTDNTLDNMKHYFQRYNRYVTTAGGELLGITKQIFLRYGGTLGYPDWIDNKHGEAANVLAVLWFPSIQAANAWATSGKLLKADPLLDATTTAHAFFPINYKPRKDSYSTYLLLEVRSKDRRGPNAIEHQKLVERMQSIFKDNAVEWSNSFIANTFVDYSMMPELQPLNKWMDKTHVFLHNFKDKFDASEFLSHLLTNAYELEMGPYVATIFDLKRQGGE